MAGNITIIPPKENFLKVSKGIIYNDDVDALSLGIYVKVIALGRKWQLNIRGLAKALHLSEDRIRNSFAVLEKAGYLRRFKTHGEHGHFNGWDYEVASDPFTDIANSPTSVKTDIGKNRHRCFDTQNRDDIIENRDDKGENRDIEEKPTPFDFKNALMELGVTEQTVTDWLSVRKTKKAKNTLSAFIAIKREVEKAMARGFTAEDCIFASASNSWIGFKAEYIVKDGTASQSAPQKSKFDFEIL